MRRFEYPFDPAAPEDTLDGLLIAAGSPDPSDVEPWMLRMFRSSMLSDLRRRRPTGVAPLPGRRVREACIAALLDRDGDEPRCHICGLVCPHPISRTIFVEVDHVVALSRGGRHHIDNLALTHRPCNQRKGSSEGITPDSARAALFGWIDSNGYSTSWIADALRADLDRVAGAPA